jgi:hypothetical protein
MLMLETTKKSYNDEEMLMLETIEKGQCYKTIEES